MSVPKNIILLNPAIIQHAIFAILPALVILAAGCDSFFNDLAGEPYKIVFDNGSNIFIMNADGTERTQLTSDGGNYLPVASPDGSQIAFCKNNTIYIMDADGSNQRLLYTNGNYMFPSWSPDGTKIVYQPNNTEIWVINTDGTGNDYIIQGLPANISHPMWSGKTNLIVYYTSGDDIFTIAPVKGSLPKQITFSGNCEIPSWSPDGSKLIYAKTGLGWDIYIRDMTTGGETPFYASAGDDHHPSWSSDGEKIVFQSMVGATYQIFVIDSDGTGLRQLTYPATGEGLNASWVP